MRCQNKRPSHVLFVKVSRLTCAATKFDSALSQGELDLEMNEEAIPRDPHVLKEQRTIIASGGLSKASSYCKSESPLNISALAIVYIPRLTMGLP
jgi:hypothetical protein